MFKKIIKNIRWLFDKRAKNNPSDEIRAKAYARKAELAEERRVLQELELKKKQQKILTDIYELTTNPDKNQQEEKFLGILMSLFAKDNPMVAELFAQDTTQPIPAVDISGFIPSSEKSKELVDKPKDELDAAFNLVSNTPVEQLQQKIAEKTGRKIPLRMLENIKASL